MITIYCQSPPHAERRWDIETFVSIGGPPGQWVKRPGFGRRRMSSSKDASTRLDGDRRLGRDEPSVAGADLRIRHNLRCKLCGLTVARRAETLNPILDELARAGVDSASLSLLAAIH